MISFFYKFIKNGITEMFVLDYGNKIHTNYGFSTSDSDIKKFAKYAAWIAERYKGKISYYEIWNEWYLATGINAKMKRKKPDDIFFLSSSKLHLSQSEKSILKRKS